MAHPALGPFNPAHPVLRTKLTYLLNGDELTALVRHYFDRPDYDVSVHGFEEHFSCTWTVHGQIGQWQRTRLERYCDKQLPDPARSDEVHPHPQTLLCGLFLLGAIPAGAYQFTLHEDPKVVSGPSRPDSEA